MSDIIIKVENLSKVYKLYDKPIDRMKEALSISKKKYSIDYYALKNVSFEIKKGETVGIIGTNGSGKSTLLKIITGVLTKTSGNIQVNGKISALLELGAGFNPEYTGLENIYLNGTMMGFSKEDIDNRVDSIIEFADIGDFLNQPIKTYSSGMFVRLAFSLSINVEPDILILDEALAVGDVKFQLKCFNKIDEFKKNGKTVVIVSHDIDSIRKFCDKVIWIENGEKKGYGDVREISSKYLEYLLGGDYSSKHTIILDENRTDVIMEDFEYNNYFINFLYRWGEHKDIIKIAILNNSYNYEQNIRIFEKIQLKFLIFLSDDIIRNDNLFLSIGIKNSKGQELLWATTEVGMFSLNVNKDTFKVFFDIDNILAPGSYSVVSCIEYRDDYSAVKDPYYLDYIDGIFLFNVLSDGKKVYSPVFTNYKVYIEDN